MPSYQIFTYFNASTATSSRSTEPEIFMPQSLSGCSQSGPPKSVGSGGGRIPHFNWSILVAKRKACLQPEKTHGYQYFLPCNSLILMSIGAGSIRAINFKGV